MAKGIVAEGCTDIIFKSNTFVNLTTAVKLTNCKNVSLDGNLVLEDEKIKEFIKRIKLPNGENLPEDLPLEYVRELLINKEENKENSDLFLWLSKEGFNASWVISTILSLAPLIL